jgi:hypothetical protein
MIIRLCNHLKVYKDFDTPLTGAPAFVSFDFRSWQRRAGQVAEPFIYDQVDFFPLDECAVVNSGRETPLQAEAASA